MRQDEKFESEESRIDANAIYDEMQQKSREGDQFVTANQNNFPVDIFPTSIQQIIIETNKHLGFPIDFISASLLYATSVAVGNTHRVKMKDTWSESAILYLALVGRPGTNKSHPLSFALKPITEHDHLKFQEYQKVNAHYKSIIKLSDDEKKAQGIHNEPQKPILEQFLVRDFTQEALAQVLICNKRGIGVHADELASWFKNFNRYNKGSEEQFWLSAWSSKPIQINRKTSDPLFINEPFISVCGTIQNGILHELAKNERVRNGFIDRILFVIPDDLRKSYWSTTDLNPSVSQNWQRILSILLQMKCDGEVSQNPGSVILELDTDARELLIQWQKENTDLINDTESEQIQGAYSKMEIYALRFALVLEMLRFACDESDKRMVSAISMHGALKLVEYFKKSALRVHSIFSSICPLDKLTVVEQTLYALLPDTFTTQEGLKIANDSGVVERTFKRFIKKGNLFNRIRRGEYEKLI